MNNCTYPMGSNLPISLRYSFKFLTLSISLFFSSVASAGTSTFKYKALELRVLGKYKFLPARRACNLAPFKARSIWILISSVEKKKVVTFLLPWLKRDWNYWYRGLLAFLNSSVSVNKVTALSLSTKVGMRLYIVPLRPPRLPSLSFFQVCKRSERLVGSTAWAKIQNQTKKRY